ncbi:MAG: hypothetical protein IDH49_13520 [Gammaproteobacteria bacterium]|nr:hypothetical protein [Gammaproteobacteria bacterium]
MNLYMTRLSRIALLGFIATLLTACDTSEKALPQTGPAPGYTGVVLNTSSDPRLAFDGNGNAIAVWSQFDGTRKNIWARRYTAASGWNTPQLIETNGGDADFPRLVFDGRGNAVVIWRHIEVVQATIEILDNPNTPIDETKFPPHCEAAKVATGSILVNRYDAIKQQWIGVQQIETDNSIVVVERVKDDGVVECRLKGHDAYNPVIAADANGDFMAVWEQYFDNDPYNNTPPSRSIRVNRYDAVAAQWQGSGLIPGLTANDPGDANAPQIAGDGKGNFTVVWRSLAYDRSAANQYNSAQNRRYNLWGNRYAAGSGWGAAALVSDNTVLLVNGVPDLTNPIISGNADTPHIAMDAAGNALAVWVQSNHLFTNRYDVTLNQWVPAPQRVDPDPNWTAAAPQIAMNAAGDAILVWEQYFDVDPHDGTPAWKNIRASRYNAATRLWGAPQLIETNDTGHALAPQIAMDALGNAMAVWQQWDDTQKQYSVWANRYDTLLGWELALLIEDIGSGDALSPHVAVDGTGNVTAVWAQHDNKAVRNRIYANRYTIGGGWGEAGLLEAH